MESPKAKFKKVPAVEKCFGVLEHLARSRHPLGITDLSQALGFHKSTVFNLVHTLMALGILEGAPENKVRLGLKFYDLSRGADPYALLIARVRPFLEEINRKLRLSVFLGLRSDRKAVIIDKVDSPQDIKVSSEVGMKIPLFAGSHGKALLAHLPEDQLDGMLNDRSLKRFTLKASTDPNQFKREIQRARRDRFAFDDEGYLKGIRSLAIPILLDRSDIQPAIWAVGLKSQISDDMIPEYRRFLNRVGKRIDALFSQTSNDPRGDPF
jgi:IclR family KDG regulon transcriptional repressor